MELTLTLTLPCTMHQLYINIPVAHYAISYTLFIVCFPILPSVMISLWVGRTQLVEPSSVWSFSMIGRWRCVRVCWRVYFWIVCVSSAFHLLFMPLNFLLYQHNLPPSTHTLYAFICSISTIFYFCTLSIFLFFLELYSDREGYVWWNSYLLHLSVRQQAMSN